MTYVQGFVAAVPKDKREAYRRHCETAGMAFREYGALRMVECWEKDIPDGEITSFPNAVRRRENEVVVFSWIIWKSKEACEAGMERMRREGQVHFDEASRILDGRRVIFGGFEVLVEL